LRTFVRFVVASVAATIALTLPVVASAHEHRAAGPVELAVGWLNEPTYAGSFNAVQLELARGGAPLVGATLQVVVIFGDRSATQKTSSLDLVPSDEKPGQYTAALIPSRPGTYTFHITGKAGGTQLDQFFTSGEKTFDDPKDPAADEFPAKDPSPGQLAQRADRIESHVAAVRSRTNLGIILAIAGIVLALGGFAVGRRS
jgi:hypothetical protein